jgi:hypothetical protein
MSQGFEPVELDYENKEGNLNLIKYDTFKVHSKIFYSQEKSNTYKILQISFL